MLVGTLGVCLVESVRQSVAAFFPTWHREELEWAVDMSNTIHAAHANASILPRCGEGEVVAFQRLAAQLITRCFGLAFNTEEPVRVLIGAFRVCGIQLVGFLCAIALLSRILCFREVQNKVELGDLSKLKCDCPVLLLSCQRCRISGIVALIAHVGRARGENCTPILKVCWNDVGSI